MKVFSCLLVLSHVCQICGSEDGRKQVEVPIQLYELKRQTQVSGERPTAHLIPIDPEQKPTIDFMKLLDDLCIFLELQDSPNKEKPYKNQEEKYYNHYVIKRLRRNGEIVTHSGITFRGLHEYLWIAIPHYLNKYIQNGFHFGDNLHRVAEFFGGSLIQHFK